MSHLVHRAGRLVDYAKAHLVVVPVGAIGGLIAAGAIRLNHAIARIAAPVRAGDQLTAELGETMLPEDVPLAICHEDDDLVVCDKPAGMHVHPLGPYRKGTLHNALLWYCGARPDQPWGAWRPAPAHRLDRAASGLVAIAKSAAAHDRFRRALASGSIARRYRATVHGVVVAETGTVDAPLGRDPLLDYRRAIVPGGQRAVTHWRVVERRAEQTVLELELETGRTHQIRAHLASLGHPIVGDGLYVDGVATEVIELRAIELGISGRVIRSGTPAPAR